MMKFLHPDLPWENIKAIGFDMDGTLYDEFDFIAQVYQPISVLLSDKKTGTDTYQFMLSRWIEKGSSYPNIFSEALERNNIPKAFHEDKIKESLEVFRNFIPVLALAPRVVFMLEHCQKHYDLFLVSDGSSVLQWNKFKALGLETFFQKENVFISGDHGKQVGKPGIASLERIPLLRKYPDPQQVVYIGDRLVDAGYAQNARFHFIKVKPIFVNAQL